MYFVILTHPGGYPLMMTDDVDDMATFDTEEAARDAALGNVLGAQIGYEIFRVGDGSQ